MLACPHCRRALIRFAATVMRLLCSRLHTLDRRAVRRCAGTFAISAAYGDRGDAGFAQQPIHIMAVTPRVRRPTRFASHSMALPQESR